MLLPIILPFAAASLDAYTAMPEPPASRAAEVQVPRALPAPPAPPAPPPPPTPYRPKTPKPKGDIHQWVRPSDYPSALHGGESGVTGFRLHIGRDGKPTGCTITFSSGVPLLDARTCEILMMRARFEPARDGFNTPAEGTFTSRVRWLAPAPQAITPGPSG